MTHYCGYEIHQDWRDGGRKVCVEPATLETKVILSDCSKLVRIEDNNLAIKMNRNRLLIMDEAEAHMLLECLQKVFESEESITQSCHEVHA